MKSKQDILNAFRETFNIIEYSSKSDEPVEIDSWLLTTLTEFERETLKKFYEGIEDYWDGWSEAKLALSDIRTVIDEIEKNRNTP